MKRLLFTLVALPACALLLNACLVAPIKPPTGSVYTNIKAPLGVDYKSTPTQGKMGVSQSISILGLVALGDASAHAAAEAGGLQRIEHADYEYKNVLGVYQRYRTIVYGQ